MNKHSGTEHHMDLLHDKWLAPVESEIIRMKSLVWLLALVLLPAAVSAHDGKHGEGGGESPTDRAIHTVVLDAGHGGHDHGCSGKNSREKEVALDLVLQVGKYIEENLPDVKVIYTRKEDVFVELHERAAIANRAKADVFISVHCNSASAGAYGTETYVMGHHRDNANLNVAKRENSAILLEDNYNQHYDGFDPNDPTAHIIFSLHQSAWEDQSIDLATRIEQQFRDRVGRRSRGVKQAGFLVLYKTAMPSVLVESGFLTNKTEEKFLISEDGKAYMASAIFRAFRDYKNAMDVRQGIVMDSDDIPGFSLEEEDMKSVTVVDESPASGPLGSFSDHDKYKPYEDNESSDNNTPAEVAAATIPKNEAMENPDQAVYLVQIYASSRKYQARDPVFKPLGGRDIYRIQRGNIYKYMVGNFENPDHARAQLEEIRQQGFKDAFVVSLTNSELSAGK